MTTKRVEFFFDVVSPYSYIAAVQVARSPLLANAEWRPFFLGGVFKATGNQAPMHVPAKAQYMVKDLARLFAYYDARFQFPAVFPTNSITAMRALTAAPADQVKDLALKLFDAYWGLGRNIGDAAVLAELLPAELLAAAADEAVKEKLKTNTDAAVSRGAFGAPSLFVDDELYFGEDRVFLIEHALKK
ncbi:MAG: 2-hydroxychromene-2-carboxylate isomerase [Moraxellaceae bacterium]|nr:2-hydroxychromene-2-carboxylate isomerase [Moraxellaceae bacterium]